MTPSLVMRVLTSGRYRKWPATGCHQQPLHYGAQHASSLKRTIHDHKCMTPVLCLIDTEWTISVYRTLWSSRHGRNYGQRETLLTVLAQRTQCSSIPSFLDNVLLSCKKSGGAAFIAVPCPSTSTSKVPRRQSCIWHWTAESMKPKFSAISRSFTGSDPGLRLWASIQAMTDALCQCTP